MNTKNLKVNGARGNKTKAQGTATETVLDRTAPEHGLATVTTVARKIRRRVTFKDDSGRATQLGVTEKTVESPKPTCDKPCAPRRSAVSRMPAKNAHRQRVSRSASRGTQSRYGCMQFPWWLDDNVQTYMELMDARELQDKLQQKLSRKAKKTRTIDRTSEKHDLSVKPKDRRVRLKRKAKLTEEQRSDTKKIEEPENTSCSYTPPAEPTPLVCVEEKAPAATTSISRGESPVQVLAPCKPTVLTVRKKLLKLKEKIESRKLQAKQRTDPET